MQTRVLEPFGLEISAFSIATAAPASIDQIVNLIARHRVAVFRDQAAGDTEFVRFLTMLGELTFTEGETPVRDAPDLNLITNAGRTAPPRSVFHTDTSYVARPPAFTGLRVVQLPSASGHTQFSDQVRAAARLSKRVRRALEGRTVRHGLAGSGEDSARHPLFRRHPLTNEVALFLSTPERCSALSGVDERQSARILAALYRHSTHSSGLYDHAWRAGDVVIWDDRVTMHRADHTGVIGTRTLHRGMVLGEIPIPA